MGMDAIYRKLDRIGQLTYHRSDVQDLLALAFQAGADSVTDGSMKVMPELTYHRNMSNAHLAGRDDERAAILEIIREYHKNRDRDPSLVTFYMGVSAVLALLGGNDNE